MGRRQELNQKLVSLLGPGVTVYFQPRENIVLSYPCVVYERDGLSRSFADNSPYRDKTRYQVTIIDRNPDSEIPSKVASLPLTNFVRFFVVDNLNHDIYSLYY